MLAACFDTLSFLPLPQMFYKCISFSFMLCLWWKSVTFCSWTPRRFPAFNYLFFGWVERLPNQRFCQTKAAEDLDAFVTWHAPSAHSGRICRFIAFLSAFMFCTSCVKPWLGFFLPFGFISAPRFCLDVNVWAAAVAMNLPQQSNDLRKKKNQVSVAERCNDGKEKTSVSMSLFILYSRGVSSSIPQGAKLKNTP